MEKRFPVIMRKKYLDYASFAGKTVEEVFGDGLKRTRELKVQTLSSALLLNTGKGMYQYTTLPAAVQYAPVYAFAAGQFNNDNYTDILCAGNLTGVSPFEGFYDAGLGAILTGSANARFNSLQPSQSGLAIKGEVRDIKTIRTINESVLFAIARNNNSILFYKKTKDKK